MAESGTLGNVDLALSQLLMHAWHKTGLVALQHVCGLHKIGLVCKPPRSDGAQARPTSETFRL